MDVDITQTGMFNLSGETSIPAGQLAAIVDLFGATSIAEDALTAFNCFAATLAVFMILFDSRRRRGTWKIGLSSRIPLGLAAAISISHIIFIVKEFVGLNSFEDIDPPKDERLACGVLNEFGYWGESSLFRANWQLYGYPL